MCPREDRVSGILDSLRPRQVDAGIIAVSAQEREVRALDAWKCAAKKIPTQKKKAPQPFFCYLLLKVFSTRHNAWVV